MNRNRLHWNRIACFLVCAGLVSTVNAADRVLICGMDEVFEIDPLKIENGKVEKLWSWRAKDQKGLPVDLQKAFGTTDECKPIRDGKQILITSSGGGCALVDYPGGEVRWHARVPNAHSIELLPKDRVVVASSTNANGNRLVIFDLSRSMEPVWHTPLVSAHGVVWDEGRNSLWALGLKELQQYRLKDWETKAPQLELVATHELPDEDGHDLQAVPGTSDLLVTTGKSVFVFDRDRPRFIWDPVIGDDPHVKAVAPIDEPSGYYLRASEEHWWTTSLRSFPDLKERPIEGERMYKVRVFRH
jgi:hypothetical protein